MRVIVSERKSLGKRLRQHIERNHKESRVEVQSFDLRTPQLVEDQFAKSPATISPATKSLAPRPHPHLSPNPESFFAKCSDRNY